jgi:hypothetical protein
MGLFPATGWTQPPTETAVLPLAELQPDAQIPTIETVTGHGWAKHITDQEEIERYLAALAQAAPDRCRLERYGKTYEGRPLHYLAISSAANIERLDAIRSVNQRLAEPDRDADADFEVPMDGMPATVWLAASVHGNELSGTDAALLTAYHLLADQCETTRQWLDKLIVIIDPLQNPDGRARFVNVYRESRGEFDSGYPLSTEHAERWPGGRFNHYLFDMNRDWFLQSQEESRGKVAAYLKWQPQVYVDAHEMGPNSSYFFPPPSEPANPFRFEQQSDWAWKLGRRQAEWFDRYGFAYTTREMFDAFYPGYGSEWPSMQGGLGVLWEQAGTRGLFVDRDDDTTLQYTDAVLHHYVSSLATLEFASEHRRALLDSFRDARQRGVQLGVEGPVRYFALPPGHDPARTAKLTQLLTQNGIRLQHLTQSLKIRGTDVRTNRAREQRIAAGTIVVPVAQPAGRLVRVLLDRQVKMDEAYVQRQLERRAAELPSEIYDVTAWSLPLAFDVPCLALKESLPQDSIADGLPTIPPAPLRPARVAYLVPPTDAALRALSDWLQAGLRVHVTNEPFSLAERKFPRGTLIIKTRDNPADTREQVERAAQQYGIEAIPADTGFVTEGSHFGGPHVKWVRPPKIALAMDRPASYTAGHTWYLFDQVLHYPTTRVACQNLARLEWNKFNVLVLPAGSYSESAGFNKAFADRLATWVKEGGTLVLVEGAALWAAEGEIGLWDLQRVAKPPIADKSKAETKSSANTEVGQEKTQPPRWPESVPGAFFRTQVFTQHWMTAGCSKSLNVFYHGDVFFEPLELEAGRNLITFADRDPVVTAGFCWPETQELVQGKTFLAYRALGEGHLVAFAADPNYRAMYPNLQRLFLNACLFGPGE